MRLLAEPELSETRQESNLKTLLFEREGVTLTKRAFINKVNIKEEGVKRAKSGAEKSMTEKVSTNNLTKHGRQKYSIFREARTRILSWYIALMMLFMGLSVPIFYQLLSRQVDRRVRENLAEDVEALREFIEEKKANGEKTSESKAVDIFDSFLSTQIPEDDEYLITFLDGQLYRSSPRALPAVIRDDTELLNYWAQITQPKQGERQTTDSTIGNLLYRVQPLTIEGQNGVFVAVHFTAGERQEVFDAVTIVVQVMFAVLVLALIFAWVASGQILTPLRSLSATALSISESNLTQRISVRGAGEIADIAITFNAMMDRLQTAFASQQNFVNDAGHELRTPITIIRGHLELLDDDPEERQITLDLVLDELDRMSRFVDELLFLAKAEQRDFLQLETVEVGSLTEKLYTKAQALAKRNWQLEAVGQGRIVADRQRITQAVMNLAQNATQHTAEADTVALGSSVDQKNARFWVRDTGTGIALKEQPGIFERFARASHSRRRSEGAGLGLSIVRAIAQTHGGRVELLSQVGVGSKFTLVLPLESSQVRLDYE